ncbi:MAG: type II toxin-antitoxin system VapC family toxin [Brevundimonas sp.]|uniref:type II toxin-antitoxin system VapC family toxin n=1 Tax=Brevundimonas sp. TaxID=1871086 RepID=UPI002588E573|nr:type II toxin-antitoxin system VapC family toxin [Brevundimonas sp.]MCV0415391.1 type II toxin-antitoxin system VapC family toxin [Brevundimonas sp.]
MRYLLDTNVAIWLIAKPERLSGLTLERLGDTSNDLVVSAVSVVEVAIKRSLGKLDINERFIEELQAQDCRFLSVNVRHAWQVSSLPWIHRDPFDRLIVAQAQIEGATLVTSDRTLIDYDVQVLLV